MDEIIPTLLEALEDDEMSNTALDGLKQIIRFSFTCSSGSCSRFPFKVFWFAELTFGISVLGQLLFFRISCPSLFIYLSRMCSFLSTSVYIHHQA